MQSKICALYRAECQPHIESIGSSIQGQFLALYRADRQFYTLTIIKTILMGQSSLYMTNRQFNIEPIISSSQSHYSTLYTADNQAIIKSIQRRQLVPHKVENQSDSLLFIRADSQHYIEITISSIQSQKPALYKADSQLFKS